jgi:hypothetical protein
MVLAPSYPYHKFPESAEKLRDGESVVIERDGDLTEEVRKICKGLKGIKPCALVRRTVNVVGGKIVITRVGTRRTLGGFDFRFPPSTKRRGVGPGFTPGFPR